MKNVFKSLGKALVTLGCTLMQLIAMILQVISLVFRTIGLIFGKASDLLMNVSTTLIAKLGIAKAEVKEETA